MSYGIRGNGKPHGKVYTKQSVVNFIIELTNQNGLLSGKTIVDPAAGSGAFIIPLVRKIQSECFSDVQKLNDALSKIYAYDIDNDALKMLRKNIESVLENRDSIKYVNIINDDFLLCDIPKADIIFGNPPYVRYDNIPEDNREKYSLLYFTFSGRADIYIPFIEKSLKNLKYNGVLSFVCADRWFNNSYGKKLRNFINHNFNLKQVVKLEGFNPFEEDVIAYPSIFLIKNNGRTSTFQYSKIGSEEDLYYSKIENIKYPELYHFNKKSEIEYDNYQEYLFKIEEQDFKIGIGVATGADKVFIIEQPDLVESDILVPLVTRKDIHNSKIVWKNRFLINTYSPFHKGLINLEQYPKLRFYFEKNRDKLENRHLARKNKNNWYKLIDPVKLELISKPKILIPDISTKNEIIVDEGKYYPHHNFYYITSDNYDELLVLRSFLSSDFIKNQVKQKGLMMNGGALRWQAQTLRKLHLPKIAELSSDVKHKLIQCYEMKQFKNLESMIQNIVNELDHNANFENDNRECNLFESNNIKHAL